MAQISDLKARKLSPGDRPSNDGTIPGLRLEPGTEKGRGKWILRFVSPITGQRRDMGLGVYPDVPIVEARRRGLNARQAIAAGKDPIKERKDAKVALSATTFKQAAEAVHEEMKPGWKNAKHAAQWIATLNEYALPVIGKSRVADLGPSDFADVLRPIWLEKPETASRVKQRCQTVMRWCAAKELVKGNPVDVVDHLLPQQPGKRVRVQHQPSMPWRMVPGFVTGTLRGEGETSVTRAILEFIILTAARSGEARQMRWEEVDIEKKVWTVPADRMKAKVIHRVPLSARAVEILENQKKKHPEADLVFPAPRGGVLSDMVLTVFLREKKVPSSDPARYATAHGFRSSFRDWASENGYARDLAERALAHTIGNQTEAAYHRTDLLEQRVNMMETWAKFIGGAVDEDNIIRFKKEAGSDAA